MTKNIIDSAKPTLRERAMDYPDIIQNITEQANLSTDIAAKLRACTEEQQILRQQCAGPGREPAAIGPSSTASKPKTGV